MTDLAAIARGAGIEHVASVPSAVEFGEAFMAALERDDLSVIVANVAAVGPEHYGMDLQLPENAFRFKRWIQQRPKTEDRGPKTADPLVAVIGYSTGVRHRGLATRGSRCSSRASR